MPNTVRAFDFEIDINGARVTTAQHPLCPGCLSDREVDAQVKLLTDDLEAVAERMKQAIREQAKHPLFLDTER